MPPILHSSDDAWMGRALSLAREARGHVWPNPPVGCVIVNDGAVVAEAATHPGGRPHAERKALDLAGQAANGATLYVTLEPCCHWGNTPPCADAIIEAGVTRVVCAIQDPDPRVDGGGFAKLRNAGLDVIVGLGRDEAEAVMSGFFHRVRFGAPEMVRSDQGPTQIPTGVDAVLVSRNGGAVVTTRSGEVEYPRLPFDQLGRRLGELGLTTVAIPEGDPLWKEGSLLPMGRGGPDPTSLPLAVNT